jgi:hypothetical protein
MLEFALGSFTTIASVAASALFIRRFLQESSFNRLKVQKYQSHALHYLFQSGALSYADYNVMNRKPLKTQATDFHDKVALRVLIVDDKAYWIEHNTLFEASIIDGQMDPSSTKTIDTMVLDKVELDKIIFVVDKLTERPDDEGSSSGK